MSELQEIVERWWAMFEDGDFGALAYKAGFPDLRHEVVATVEAGDTIALELHITMTHTGTFVTPMGDLAPSGNVVELDACDVVRVNSEGRISSWHSYFDQASMLAQL
jgi:predicted ester cyclase